MRYLFILNTIFKNLDLFFGSIIEPHLSFDQLVFIVFRGYGAPRREAKGNSTTEKIKKTKP